MEKTNVWVKRTLKKKCKNLNFLTSVIKILSKGIAGEAFHGTDKNIIGQRATGMYERKYEISKSKSGREEVKSGQSNNKDSFK